MICNILKDDNTIGIGSFRKIVNAPRIRSLGEFLSVNHDDYWL